jgi:hypothetical protein
VKRTLSQRLLFVGGWTSAVLSCILSCAGGYYIGYVQGYVHRGPEEYDPANVKQQAIAPEAIIRAFDGP